MFDQEALADDEFRLVPNAEDILYGTLLNRLSSSGYIDLEKVVHTIQLDAKTSLHILANGNLKRSYVTAHDKRMLLDDYCRNTQDWLELFLNLRYERFAKIVSYLDKNIIKNSIKTPLHLGRVVSVIQENNLEALWQILDKVFVNSIVNDAAQAIAMLNQLHGGHFFQRLLLKINFALIRQMALVNEKFANYFLEQKLYCRFTECELQDVLLWGKQHRHIAIKLINDITWRDAIANLPVEKHTYLLDFAEAQSDMAVQLLHLLFVYPTEKNLALLTDIICLHPTAVTYMLENHKVYNTIMLADGNAYAGDTAQNYLLKIAKSQQQSALMILKHQKVIDYLYRLQPAISRAFLNELQQTFTSLEIRTECQKLSQQILIQEQKKLTRQAKRTLHFFNLFRNANQRYEDDLQELFRLPETKELIQNNVILPHEIIVEYKKTNKGFMRMRQYLLDLNQIYIAWYTRFLINLKAIELKFPLTLYQHEANVPKIMQLLQSLVEVYKIEEAQILVLANIIEPNEIFRIYNLCAKDFTLIQEYFLRLVNIYEENAMFVASNTIVAKNIHLLFSLCKYDTQKTKDKLKLFAKIVKMQEIQLLLDIGMINQQELMRMIAAVGYPNATPHDIEKNILCLIQLYQMLETKYLITNNVMAANEIYTQYRDSTFASTVAFIRGLIEIYQTNEVQQLLQLKLLTKSHILKFYQQESANVAAVIAYFAKIAKTIKIADLGTLIAVNVFKQGGNFIIGTPDDEVDAINKKIADLSQILQAKETQALLEVKGILPDDIDSFYSIYSRDVNRTLDHIKSYYAEEFPAQENKHMRLR